jgi:hypothetical protein
MIRKKLIIPITVFVFLLLLILTFTSEKSFVAKQNDLNKMINVIKKNNGIIHHWSLLAREAIDPKTTLKDIKKLEEQYKSSYSKFTWQKKQTEDRWELTGIFFNKEQQYNETLQIIADLTSEQIRGYYIYKIDGKQWNEELETKIHSYIEGNFVKIFHKKPIIFSCIMGEFSDNMNIAVLKKAKDILNDFHGKMIEQLEEKQFISLTTYSPKFTETLPSEKGSFNLQIALRSEGKGEKTNFAIGTPIITSEY